VLALVDVLKRTHAFLEKRGIPSPRLEAELLLGHALGLDRVKLYLEFDRPLREDELAAIRALVARRGRREPLYWILGTRGFHDIELLVHSGVLVPRPDTEALVEAVLGQVPEHERVFIADVGCGTGAVGLALAHARPDARVYCIDIDQAALTNTRANVAALDLSARVAVLSGSMLAPIPPHRPVDWVVSNPPYIASAELAELEPEVRDWEPRSALDGGADGLDFYRSFLPLASERARIGVAVEIGHDQGLMVRQLFEAAGLTGVTVTQDLAGNDRVVLGRTTPAA